MVTEIARRLQSAGIFCSHIVATPISVSIDFVVFSGYSSAMAAGRPKKKKADIMSDMLRIRIKPSERAVLEKAAASDSRQLSAWARLQLLKAAGQTP